MPILLMPLLSPDWIVTSNAQAHVLHTEAQYERAEMQYRAILPWAGRRQRAVVLNNLAMLLKDQGRASEGFALVEESLGIRRIEYGPRHHETWISLSNLGSLYGATGDWKTAGKLFRQVLSERLAAGECQADAYVNVALVEKLEGRFADSLRHLSQALEIQKQMEKPNWRSVVALRNNLGTSLMAIGKMKQARGHFLAALEAVPHQHPVRAQVLLSLANLEIAEHHWQQARVSIEEALGLGGKNQSAAEKMLAWVEYYEGKWEAAELRIQRLMHPGKMDTMGQADAAYLMAHIEIKRKREQAAIAALEKSIEMTRQSIGVSASSLRGTYLLYAKLMREQQRFAEAAKAEQQVITLETRIALAH
ncbi:MAG: tetratricopeptide repeat protein [Acidobacteria bacterium]|nr:tetratricopeptide repeat protein [Acidobacteriota bacterium]